MMRGWFRAKRIPILLFFLFIVAALGLPLVSGQELEIAATTSSSTWTLDPENSPNELSGTITVNSDAGWQIMVRADTTTGGYPTEFDTSTSEFVADGKNLSHPMKISAEGGNEVDLSDPEDGLLIEGSGDKTIQITLKQEVTWSDIALPEGRSYRIVLSFIGTPFCISPPSIESLNTNAPGGQVVPGNTATLSVTASGVDLAYQWSKYDADSESFIPLEDDGRISGSIAPMLTISDFTCSDNGSYRVNVSNPCGYELREADLYSNPITTQPGDEADVYGDMNGEWVINGGTAHFSVGVDHPEAYSYRWQFQEPGSSSWVSIEDGEMGTGATTPNLQYSASSEDDGYLFKVKITKGDCIWWSDPAVLRVGVLPLPDKEVLVGETVHFETRPSDNDQYSYLWEFYNPLSEEEGIIGADSNELSFVAEAEDYIMFYRVTVEERSTGISETSNEVLVWVGTYGPDDLEVLEGETVSFLVGPADGDRYSYEWEVSSDDGDTWEPIGTDSSELTFTASAEDDRNEYRVTVTSKENADISEMSRVATLSVYGPLTIRSQPRDLTLCGDHSSIASFSIGTTGGVGDLEYQWFKVVDGESIQLFDDDDHIYGATSDTLTIDGIESSDLADYYVEVTDSLGSTVTSTSATLAISSNPAIEWVEISPSSRVVERGGTATLSVTASGSGLAYSWYKGVRMEGCQLNGPPLADGGDISGANTPTLTISNFDCSDEGCYYAVVSNPCGFDGSPVDLYLKSPITAEPESIWVLNGDTATFRAVVDSPEDYDYQWYDESYFEIMDATTYDLSFTATPADNGKSFWVIITQGECSWWSEHASLLVCDGPYDQAVLKWGDPAEFSVSLHDTARFDYQWQRSSDGGASWENVGTNDYYYRFTTSTDDSTRIYRVAITETATGVSKSSAAVRVRGEIVGPFDQTIGVCEGQSSPVHFSVQPADETRYDYTWYYSDDGGDPWTEYSSEPSFDYQADINDDGLKWKVLIGNPATEYEAYSRVATLTVYNRPCIQTPPENQNACSGDTATFSIGATGDSLEYQWYKATPVGTTDLINDGRISGADTDTLTIFPVESSDAANYGVVIRGLHDSVADSSRATLAVGPPSLISEPQDEVACLWESVWFTVDTSWGSYDYQWQSSIDDGISWDDITGQTGSSLSFDAEESDDGKKYRCRVSYAGTDCYTFSDVANLTIITQPRLYITMEDNPDPVSPEGDITYTIGYRNEYCAWADDVVVEMNHDTNVEFVSADPDPDIEDPDIGYYRWNLGPLDGGDSGTIKVRVRVKPSLSSGSVRSTATISCAGGVPAEASSLTEVSSDAPLLYIEKSSSNQVISPGYDLRYDINVENRGESALTNVTVNDTVDKHLQFFTAYPMPTRISVDGEGTHLWWSAEGLDTESLQPGESRQINVWVYMPYEEDSKFDSVYNSYNVSSDEIWGNSNTLETFVVHSLWVRKKAEKQAYSLGDTVNYTISYGNTESLPAENVVVTDVLPDSKYMDYVGASPEPSAINGNVLVWNIGTLLNDGVNRTIQVYGKLRENYSETSYKSSGFVSGEGFANIHQKLDTAEKPDRLTNYANITGYYIEPTNSETKSSSATILLADALGTAATITGHGSGIYKREDITQMLTKNRSIQVKTSLSEVYGPTSFSLPKGRSVNYDSKWSEAQATMNRITGASTNERYMYATRIDRESKINLDKNGSTVASETSFEGAGHIGVLKTPGTQERYKDIPTYESREDYLGSFTVSSYVDEYGKNLATNRSVSGRGMASSDRRITNKQRSYESGTGAYHAEERTDTLSNYMAKDLNASHEPVSYAYTPDVKLSLSKKWKEGMWSRSGPRNIKGPSGGGPTSFIGEEFSDADFLNVSTEAPGLNEMNTEAEFSGKAEFKAAKETASGGDELALYDEYIGKYKISRKMTISGVSRYDMPHISISKVGRAETPEGLAGSSAESIIVNYTITVENDGNRALGPVYITDTFPPGTKYVYSSSRPTEIAADHAVWTILALGIGSSTQIELKLKSKEGMEGLVNCVQADGAYDDEWVTARNCSAIQFNYLSCCPPQLLVTKVGYVDPLDAKLVHYSITLGNLKNSSIVADISDHLPSGLEFLDMNTSVTPSNINSSTNEVQWSAIEIKPGENRTIYYDCRALWGGTFENLVHVEAYTMEGAEFTSNDVMSSVRVEGDGYRSASTWQPPSCFNLSCTLQQGYRSDWMPCDSCGASETTTLAPAPLSEQGCPSCDPSGGTDDGYDIP